MPEITFNFNVNIKCDPAILGFLKILQGIKPVGKQPEIKPEEQSGLYEFTKFTESLNQVAENYKEDKEKKPEPEKPVLSYRKEKSEYKEVRKRGVKEQVNTEEIKEKILSFVRITGETALPYSSGISSEKGKILREKLYIHLGTKNTLWIKRAIEELIKEGKLIKSESPDCKNKRSFVYALSEEKKQAKELIQYFKDKYHEEEEDEEDMIRADNAIDVPSPERGPKREIKRKCPKCGGQLWKRNSAEENYMDAEARFLELPKETYYQCFQCGSIIKELKKEALAA